MRTDARQSLGTNIILGQVKNVLEKYPKCPGMSWICPGNCFSKKSGHPVSPSKQSYFAAESVHCKMKLDNGEHCLLDLRVSLTKKYSTEHSYETWHVNR